MAVGIVHRPDTQRKLEILSTDAQYDLACACGTRNNPAEHRQRGADGRWIYPVTLPNGGTSVLFKTLISNVCTSDCRYCPLRHDRDVRRCSLGVDETVRVFLDYYRRGRVFGLFLSSGLIGDADRTMERLTAVAERLRYHEGFRGYIHLKVLPGASDAAIEKAVRLATAVSLNIETPGADHLARLSARKDFIRDIVRPMKLIARLTGRGGRYARVKQTTQFIVGAAGETDVDIVRYTGRLYRGLGLQRVYFSAYQRGPGDDDLPGERMAAADPHADSHAVPMREHRLYQVDFLLRTYGFEADEIVFEADGRLSLEADPKLTWARAHPEYFPVDVNAAPRRRLLRVPGLGRVAVDRILERRRQGRIGHIDDLAAVVRPHRRAGRLLEKPRPYLAF